MIVAGIRGKNSDWVAKKRRGQRLSTATPFFTAYILEIYPVSPGKILTELTAMS